MGTKHLVMVGAVVALVFVLVIGYSEPALALACSEYAGPYGVRQAVPDNVCEGTNPKTCAFVYNSGNGGVRAKVNGPWFSTDAFARHNSNLVPPGSYGSAPSMYVNTNTAVHFKTFADWSGQIIADAPGGEAVLWQGGLIWKKVGTTATLIAHFGQKVAEGPGLKSATNYVVTGIITNSGGSGSYKMGSEFQAEAWETLIGGNNDVNFYSGDWFIKTNKVRIEYPAGSGC
ncbi:MAG: hypothetical protein MN733_20395 [Nitrososphaera sp.]|nr:hypothetical protein [Nitrososphaera sp.]